MANTSEYRLHAKYENIPLEFGSPILVNNGNITDEFAEKLLKHKNGERYFSQMPEPGAKKQAKSETPKAPRQKKDKGPAKTKETEKPKEENIEVKDSEQVKSETEENKE